jgi:NADH-quinone oxidoreductase subunit N
MSVLPFLVIAVGAATVATLGRRWRTASLVVGLAGLVAATVAALEIRAGDALTIGGGTIVGNEYARLFLVLGCGSAVLLALVGAATLTQRDLPAAALAMFGAAGLALAAAEPLSAIAVTIAGSLVGILVTIAPPITGRTVVVAGRELRAIAVAGVVALAATAWIAALGSPRTADAVFGLAYLALAVAVALRFGAIPFHLWATRLADTVSELALPLLMAWLPSALAVVALGWVDTAVAPLAVPLETERGVLVAIALATLLLGSFAAAVQDDLRHVVGYSIVQDAGFILLGLSILDPAAWEPARTWVLVYCLVKTAFAAWALAVRTAYGTRQLGELSGWARRSPPLAVALVVIVAATIGWPGLLAYEARGTLVDLAFDGPVGAVAYLGGISALLYYGRVLAIGLGRESGLVRSGTDWWPRRAEPAVTSTEPPDPVVPAWRRRRGQSRAAGIRATWAANRAPAAAGFVLVLAVVAFAGAAGALGIAEAARGLPPAAGVPGEAPPDVGPGVEGPGASPVPGASTGPSFQPLPSP